MQNLTIDGKRLWDTLMETARFGAASKGGLCRLTLSDSDRAVRDWFKAQYLLPPDSALAAKVRRRARRGAGAAAGARSRGHAGHRRVVGRLRLRGRARSGPVHGPATGGFPAMKASTVARSREGAPRRRGFPDLGTGRPSAVAGPRSGSSRADAEHRLGSVEGDARDRARRPARRGGALA